MSQHTLREIQQLKQEVALLKEEYDANARVEALWEQISHLDGRLKRLEEIANR